jgi:hypothetical protein
MTNGADMKGVGEKLIEALRAECTSDQPDRYALRRLAALVDELYEIEGARPVIGRAYHQTLEVTDRRKRMAVVE